MVTMTPEAAQQNAGHSARLHLTKLVYAVLFLILTGASFFVFSGMYYRHLAMTEQNRSLWLVNQYSPLAQSVFYLLQLLVLLYFFRPLRQILAPPTAPDLPRRFVYRDIGIGFSAGLVALGAALPGFLGAHHQSSVTVAFLTQHFDGIGVAFLLLIVFLLPWVSEVFFRGVVLRLLLENVSVGAALIVSILLFTLSWPVFNLFAAFVLGLAASILFYRTRSVLSCVVANFCFTVGAIALQFWRSP